MDSHVCMVLICFELRLRSFLSCSADFMLWLSCQRQSVHCLIVIPFFFSFLCFGGFCRMGGGIGCNLR